MTLHSPSTKDIGSTLDDWASRHTPSETVRKAIIHRALSIAAFDERFVAHTPSDEDMRLIIGQVATEMLEEMPVALACSDIQVPITDP